jgi:hypothetical protein
LKEKAIAVVVSQQIFVIFKKTNCENFWNFFGFSSVKMTKFSIFWKKIEKKKKKKKKTTDLVGIRIGACSAIYS